VCIIRVSTFTHRTNKEAGRAANLASLAHQFDLQARKAISALMEDIYSASATRIDPKKVRVLGKDLSILKQRHVTDIHKLRVKHTDAQVLSELVAGFQHDMQELVRGINAQK
jgi:hypothetical protein